MRFQATVCVLLLSCGGLTAADSTEEVKWARGVVDDFWHSLATGDADSAAGLLSGELVQSLSGSHNGSAAAALWEKFPSAMYAGKMDVSVTDVAFAPDRNEIVFKGAVAWTIPKGVVAGLPNGETYRRGFKMRMGKQAGGCWSIRYLDVKEREPKKP